MQVNESRGKWRADPLQQAATVVVLKASPRGGTASVTALATEVCGLQNFSLDPLLFDQVIKGRSCPIYVSCVCCGDWVGSEIVNSVPLPTADLISIRPPAASTLWRMPVKP
jgi:hypothetical protein